MRGFVRITHPLGLLVFKAFHVLLFGCYDWVHFSLAISGLGTRGSISGVRGILDPVSYPGYVGYSIRGSRDSRSGIRKVVYPGYVGCRTKGTWGIRFGVRGVLDSVEK